jgi:hypothetical protein
MDIVISQESGPVPVTVLSLRGELDLASEHEMETCVQGLIAAGARHVVIDLAGIPYLGQHWISAIDRILLFLLDYQPRRDCERLANGIRAGRFKSPYVKLLNPTPPTYQALHRAGVDMYLEIYHDLSEVIASFGPGPALAEQADHRSRGDADHRWHRLGAFLWHVAGRHRSLLGSS